MTLDDWKSEVERRDEIIATNKEVIRGLTEEIRALNLLVIAYRRDHEARLLKNLERPI